MVDEDLSTLMSHYKDRFRPFRCGRLVTGFYHCHTRVIAFAVLQGWLSSQLLCKNLSINLTVTFPPFIHLIRFTGSISYMITRGQMKDHWGHKITKNFENLNQHSRRVVVRVWNAWFKTVSGWQMSSLFFKIGMCLSSPSLPNFVCDGSNCSCCSHDDLRLTVYFSFFVSSTFRWGKI